LPFPSCWFPPQTVPVYSPVIHFFKV
jgi:hypothetical protein